jgi:hypothetical protein
MMFRLVSISPSSRSQTGARASARCGDAPVLQLCDAPRLPAEFTPANASWCKKSAQSERETLVIMRQIFSRYEISPKSNLPKARKQFAKK